MSQLWKTPGWVHFPEPELHPIGWGFTPERKRRRERERARIRTEGELEARTRRQTAKALETLNQPIDPEAKYRNVTFR